MFPLANSNILQYLNFTNEFRSTRFFYPKHLLFNLALKIKILFTGRISFCSETSEMYAFCKPDESTNSNAVGERSMSQPNRKLKRYSAGLAKWCQRYISECYGQRVHKHCVNRAKNFLTKLALSDE